jgi:hypothetical protein
MTPEDEELQRSAIRMVWDGRLHQFVPAKDLLDQERGGLFAAVPLDWLSDRRWDEVFPTRLRLYLYLVIKSRRGQKPVRLTNAMAAEIGLTKQSKMRTLRWLEARGFLRVVSRGSRTPLIDILVAWPGERALSPE